MSQLRYWIWLTSIPKLSLRSQIQLIQHFKTPENVFLAERNALLQSGILKPEELHAVLRRDLQRANGILEDCDREDISILTIQDADYPQRLASIEQPPLVLYFKGKLLPFDSLPAIAVVGARQASAYGQAAARQLGKQMAKMGGVIVSGAAKGVDSQALQGALEVDAPTAAVLGNGLDVVYPYGSEWLYQDICRKGCLLSEYPPGTRPLGSNFPRRNRILSGLSLAVLVVEAGAKSGSLITAEFALEQGRDVYAVPGNLGVPNTVGTNRLIQSGAELVMEGWDVLRAYQYRFPNRLHRQGAERLDLSLLDNDPHVPLPTLRFDRCPEETEDAKESTAPEETSEEAENTEDSTAPEETSEEKVFDNPSDNNYIDLQEVIPNLPPEQQTLLELLRGHRVLLDDLLDQSGIPMSLVLSSLTMLEFNGLAAHEDGMWYCTVEA